MDSITDQRVSALPSPQLTDEFLMPFKSRAQRRKFAQLLVEGKISNQTFEEWNRETGGKILPERVKSKTTRSRKKARPKAKQLSVSRRRRAKR